MNVSSTRTSTLPYFGTYFFLSFLLGVFITNHALQADNASCIRAQSSTFWSSHSTEAVESQLFGYCLHQHGLCDAIIRLL